MCSGDSAAPQRCRPTYGMGERTEDGNIDNRFNHSAIRPPHYHCNLQKGATGMDNTTNQNGRVGTDDEHTEWNQIAGTPGPTPRIIDDRAAGRPRLSPWPLLKCVFHRDHLQQTNAMSANARPGTANTQGGEDAEATRCATCDADAGVCEECGMGADCPTGCRLTCSMVDVPHPTMRKFVATSSIEDCQRWADARGSGLRERTAPDMRGQMAGTQAALARANMLAFSCPACEGLTDLSAARRAARRQGRQRLLGSDGCYRCGPSVRPGKLAKAQMGKVQAVGRGGKLLIVRPEWATQRQGLRMLSGQEAHQATTRAIAALPPQRGASCPPSTDILGCTAAMSLSTSA